MSRPSVYLAGPITGLTYDEGQDWRRKLAAELHLVGIDAFSPLRQKQYLKLFGQLDSGGLQSNYLKAHPLSDPAGIVARDRNDVIRRDMTLVNLLGAERVSIGSVMEIAWADLARRPCVVVMEEEGNVHDHAMIHASVGYVTHSLDTALDIVKAVLLP